MRYGLIGVGLFGIILGILIDVDKGGVLWLHIGAVCLAIGLATCDIVAAIRTVGDPIDYSGRMERFRNATRTGDLQTIVQMLKDGGVPEDLAERTAESVLQKPESVRM
ncbi:MAG: hypothetical protein ACYC6Y_26760 [Thermoguttaceae bacterium]